MKKTLFTFVIILSLSIASGANAYPHNQTRNHVQSRLCEIFSHMNTIYSNLFPLPVWCDGEEPDPEPSPTPSPTPTPTPTSTPMPTLTPTPEPNGENHLLITEVYYDVDSEHGTEGTNEWVEIYNGTGDTVDMSGWMLEDNSSGDVFGENLVLTDDSFAVITNNSSTKSFWAWPAGTLEILLESNIGNSLANTGDVVHLKDTSSTIVDSVSWGSNTDAFDPSVPDVAEGHSIARDDETVDTDTAADWIDLESPDPGN